MRVDLDACQVLESRHLETESLPARTGANLDARHLITETHFAAIARRRGALKAPGSPADPS
ncbi:MAG: hypothetical protein U0R24_09995 [Solirubrobacterales bacterium]